MRKFLIAALLAASSAAAQEVTDCDWRANAENIMEPWAENTATFAGGRVRIAALDTIEPALGAFHVLIISPPFDEVGARQCKIVSYGGGMGFSGIDFGGLNARYDPSTGLSFTLPIKLPTDEGRLADATLDMVLNQATGAIDATVSRP